MKILKYNKFKNVSGKKLKLLRLENNLTQKELSQKLQLLGIDISAKEISKIENDDRLVQDFELFAFAKVFNVPAEEFNSQI